MFHFYKVVREDMSDERRRYEIGLNEDVEPMFYCDANQIPYHLDDGTYLAVISCPLPRENRSHRKDRFYVTNNFFIEETLPLKDWRMWDDEKFCSEAVRKNLKALQYVKNPTFEMVEEVFQENYEVLEFLLEETVTRLIRKIPKILSLIDEERQTLMMCFIALCVDRENISFIKKPINKELINEINDITDVDLMRFDLYDDFGEGIGVNNVVEILEEYLNEKETE